VRAALRDEESAAGERQERADSCETAAAADSATTNSRVGRPAIAAGAFTRRWLAGDINPSGTARHAAAVSHARIK
jgi:hypothetical protein